MTPAPSRSFNEAARRLSAPERARLGARASRHGVTSEQYLRTCLGYAYPPAADEAGRACP